MDPKIVIIGAGPTGLGSAVHLNERQHRCWKVFEKNPFAGGLSASYQDNKGFIWDVGGHIVFSHYAYFDNLVGKVLGSDLYRHQRSSWVYCSNSWVPYPFQNNIRYLPLGAMWKCLLGALRRGNEEPANFSQWIYSVFGKGIAEYFMIPYNQKLWQFPLEKIGSSWVSDRVSVISKIKVLGNVIFGKDDVSWGPNNRFVFPKYGGTGEIYKRIANMFPQNVYYNKELASIDTEKKEICFKDGHIEHYNICVSTMPLDILVGLMRPSSEEVRALATQLKHNSVLVVGIGLAKASRSSKCWMYFPGSEHPFYRVTNFSRYSPYNVPGGQTDKYSSLMCEIAYDGIRRIDKDKAVSDTIESLVNIGFMENSDREKVVSVFTLDVAHAYPIPSLGRDRTLAKIIKYLEDREIYSRGRFGAWMYEIGNMDHSLMQGYQVINRILDGVPESVFKGLSLG